MKFRKIFFLAVGIGVVFALSSCNKKKQNHINLASKGADGPIAIYIANNSSTLSYSSYI
jgi:lipoprotein